jgi:copper chaperone CopZ
MEAIELHVPTLYGDHHVIKVRQILNGLPGVVEAHVSAAQQHVRVTFEPAQISAEAITAALTQAGYTPGEAPGALNPPLDELRHVAAADRAETTREAKYAPPTAFGACPGLEPKAVAGEHPADRKT